MSNFGCVKSLINAHMKYSVTFRTIVYPTLCKISLSAVRITIYITWAYRESISYIPIGRLRNPLRSVLMTIHIKWRRRWWRWPATMMANNDYFSTRIRELNNWKFAGLWTIRWFIRSFRIDAKINRSIAIAFVQIIQLQSIYTLML